jgi:hypothetical protein
VNYYFSATSIPDVGVKTKSLAKGVFRSDGMLVVNLNGKDFVEFLLDRIEITATS